MRSNLTLLHPLAEFFPMMISFFFCSLFIACVFIVKTIIMNFLEDRDVGIFYLSTKFEFYRSTKNGYLLKHRQTDTQTELSDTLPI